MHDSEEMKNICALLKTAKTIAVVGLSDKWHRTSYQIAEQLLKRGYKVVGVNPIINKSGEIEVFPDLTSIPFEIDIVNVFRRSAHIPELIADVLAIKPKAFWLQEGIRNDSAVKPLIESGIFTIQDKCIAVYHSLCRAYQN